MTITRLTKTAIASVFILNASIASAELPVLGALGIGGDGLQSSLPLIGGVLGDPLGTVNQLSGSLLFANGGRSLLDGVPVLESLPVLDGRGLPVVRDVEGALLIADGLLEIVLSNHKLGAGIPLAGAGSLSLTDVLLNSDPALQAVLPF